MKPPLVHQRGAKLSYTLNRPPDWQIQHFIAPDLVFSGWTEHQETGDVCCLSRGPQPKTSSGAEPPARF